MKRTNTIAKHAILASMLGAIGLPASMSNAQFKVEYSDAKNAPKASAKDSDDQHVIVIQSNDNEHKYEVKIVNGKVEFAQIDGKELKKDRVQIKEEVIVFLGEDGKALHKLRAPGVMSWTQGQPVQIEMLATSGDDRQFVIETNVEQPRVMLGINLSEPGEAMRKQLNLGEDQQVILVEKVIDGLPAKKAGLEAFDVIISIDGSDYANGELLSKVLRKKNPGDELKLYVLRGGEKKKITATLTEYNAKKLGVTPPPAPETPRLGLLRPDPNPNANQGQDQGRRFGFMMNFGPELHEQIMGALKESGLSEEEITRVQEQLHEQLGDLSRFFEQEIAEFSWHEEGEHEHESHETHDDHEHEHAIRVEREQHERVRAEANQQREYAQLAREKARQAIREAERQVMELRDGRLIVRSAERMDDELGRLEARLDALEARLEGQMDRFESQLDRMSSMFERLLNRLEQGDE